MISTIACVPNPTAEHLAKLICNVANGLLGGRSSSPRASECPRLRTRGILRMIKVNSVYATIQGIALTGTPDVADTFTRSLGRRLSPVFASTKRLGHGARDQQASALANAQAVPGRWIDLCQRTNVAYRFRRNRPKTSGGWHTHGWRTIRARSIYTRPLALHDRCFKVAPRNVRAADGHMQANVDWICVSPKFDMPGGKTVRDDVMHKTSMRSKW